MQSISFNSMILATTPNYVKLFKMLIKIDVPYANPVRKGLEGRKYLYIFSWTICL